MHVHTKILCFLKNIRFAKHFSSRIQFMRIRLILSLFISKYQSFQNPFLLGINSTTFVKSYLFLSQNIRFFKIPFSQDSIWPCSFNPISFYLKISRFSKYLSLRVQFGHAHLIISIFSRFNSTVLI